ncbi:MAG: hypothetical protein IJT34_02155 [Butyrivibrio sp.]|nr:hypothetical protein [Butyrivibrio sp.]
MNKRIWKSMLAVVMALVMAVMVLPAATVQARKEMKVAKVSYDITRGKWLMFHTYLPYFDGDEIKVYEQKMQMKLNKYKDELVDGKEITYLDGTKHKVRRITATFQVTIPTKSANQIVSGIKKEDYFDQGTKADDVLSCLNTLALAKASDAMPGPGENVGPGGASSILRDNPYLLANFFDIVVTDYKTGENLLTDDTRLVDDTDPEGLYPGSDVVGENYHYVEAHMSQRWAPTTTARQMETASGLHTYYEEYFCEVRVDAPVEYDRISIGVAGINKKAVKRLSSYSIPNGNIPSYIYVFNESFYAGYATFMNSAYWKKGDKKQGHYLRADKKIVPDTTNNRTVRMWSLWGPGF